ncbi:hypothetical protein H310_00082 [Aphanomyces invadans]|uniref:Uncharacterized protein n=1 Tax=Aphanomyces invadans TaxID=157072 RepID=A0A024UU93_9STRA|nr:hypothetical protein H310_00082 [Aphanomyces invadans]ETW09520.1 hypothetical protein H310_00082 [Aphanomyces invadans]|eukprot:XP_008860931.1 hypothetical protein H310_00082 [Aphanomyces invadans]
METSNSTQVGLVIVFFKKAPGNGDDSWVTLGVFGQTADTLQFGFHQRAKVGKQRRMRARKKPKSSTFQSGELAGWQTTLMQKPSQYPADATSTSSTGQSLLIAGMTLSKSIFL